MGHDVVAEGGIIAIEINQQVDFIPLDDAGDGGGITIGEAIPTAGVKAKALAGGIDQFIEGIGIKLQRVMGVIEEKPT